MFSVNRANTSKKRSIILMTSLLFSCKWCDAIFLYFFAEEVLTNTVVCGGK
jgi:hypothetical protein